MEIANKLEAWHKTRLGYGFFGLAELAITYGFASWAINSGSLWLYALTLIFLFGGLRNLVRIFKPHEQSPRAKQN